MASARPSSITHLLHAWRAGDSSAADRLLAATYNDLRLIARRLMQRERGSHTLQATALVHEAYLRLTRGAAPDLGSRDAFFAAMAAHMRRHLVDHARRRGAAKRGGGVARVPFDDAIHGRRDPSGSPERFFESLDRALDALAAEHPRCAEVIRLRFLAGLSVEDAARRLGLSSGTIKRDLAFGRAWLLRRLQADDQ
jgi:RNA polymerase sigma factor (TIGR02999 family)